MKKAIVLMLLCCLSAALLSCSGSNTTIVFISPVSATVNKGGTLQFTANVPVTWSVSGNASINSAGFFTAGNTAGNVTVTAIATDGSHSSGTATVTIGTTTTTTTTTTPSHIAHRVFVSNKYSGVLNIINADTDTLSTSVVSVGGQPTFMVQTSDLTGEVVYESSTNSLRLVSNTTETIIDTSTPSSGTITSTAIIPGASAVYAAVPTASVTIDSSGNAITGTVYRVDFPTGGILSVGIQGARFFAMDHNAVNMLVFSQNCDAVTWVSSTAGALTSNTGTLTGIVLPGGTAPTASCPATTAFSRPVSAVFSADDTLAYVLSSGPVNSGSQAMVTVLDMTPALQSPPSMPTVLQTVNVSAANVGLLQGTQLYVAGAALATCSSDTTQTCQQGVLSVIDTGTNTVTSSVPFGPNAPTLLPGVLTSDGTNLWIGSTGCQILTAGAPGCLSLYLPGNAASSQILTNTPAPTGSTPLSDANDDVTSMVWLQPFNGRKVMYVIEGGPSGTLIAYNITGGQLTKVSTPNLVIIGQLVDAKAVK